MIQKSILLIQEKKYIFHIGKLTELGESPDPCRPFLLSFWVIPFASCCPWHFTNLPGCTSIPTQSIKVCMKPKTLPLYAALLFFSSSFISWLIALLLWHWKHYSNNSSWRKLLRKLPWSYNYKRETAFIKIERCRIQPVCLNLCFFFSIACHCVFCGWHLQGLCVHGCG